jgi:hypothetical protein
MGVCRLCRSKRKLVESHIIPESMYPFGDGPRQPLVKIQLGQHTRRGRSPAGEYDPGLVCEQCEAIFSPWDDYAYRLLTKQPEASECIYEGGKLIACKISRYNYTKLKLFFISIMWKSTESDRPVFRQVRIGKRHTEMLAHMLRTSNPGTPDDYAVMIARLTDQGEAHKSVRSPYSTRWQERRFWRFYFGGYTCMIKVDQQPMPAQYSPYILTPDSPLRVMVMRFDKLEDYQHLASDLQRRAIATSVKVTPLRPPLRN